jgi:hypothetical protein
MNRLDNDITDTYSEEYGEIVDDKKGEGLYKVLEYEKSLVLVEMDDDPLSPIDDPEAHFGHMICFHPRYNLGDPHTEGHQHDPHDFMDWIDYEVQHNTIEFLMLYLYDHSGITMGYSYTYPYDDRWDAGRVGIMYATLDDIRENYGVKRVTKALRQKALDHLKAIVDEYDDYLRGDAYGFEVVCKRCGNIIDGCWGFLGDDLEKSGMLDQIGDGDYQCPTCPKEDMAFWAKVDATVMAGE